MKFCCKKKPREINQLILQKTKNIKKVNHTVNEEASSHFSIVNDELVSGKLSWVTFNISAIYILINIFELGNTTQGKI